MTIIAWDGTTLAADKQVTCNDLKKTITKIFKTDLGLIGVSGVMNMGMAIKTWLLEGAIAELYPEISNEPYTQLILINKEHQLITYQGCGYPLLIEDKIFAMGSGRDFAYMAMYLGKTAKEAVELTNLFNASCGMGIDTLTLEE